MPALKTRTTQLCSDPNIDRLFAMVLALGAEVTAISEQLDTMKRLIVQHNVLTSEELESYVPSAGIQSERDEARRAFIGNLMASLDQDIDKGVAS